MKTDMGGHLILALTGNPQTSLTKSMQPETLKLRQFRCMLNLSNFVVCISLFLYYCDLSFPHFSSCDVFDVCSFICEQR